MTANHSDVRNFLVEELKRDLVGPEAINEILDEGPVSRYLAGILYPRDTSIDGAEDNDGGEAAEDDDEVDTGTLMASATNPSSIGLTFTVPVGEEILVEISAAIYVKDKDLTGSHDIFARKPLEIQPVILTVEEKDPNDVTLATGLELHYRIRVRGDNAIVTLSVVNRLQAPKNERADGYSFFQPEIKVKSTQEGKALFLPRINERELKSDPDRALNALLYRHAPEFAVGHGCATEWIDEGGKGKEIWTVFVPAFEILQLSPDPKETYPAQRMKFLAEQDQDDVIPSLNKFLDDYIEWTTRLDSDSAPENLRGTAVKNIGECRAAAERIREGINFLANDPLVFQAFQLANRAMLIQRSRITWLKEPKDLRSSGPEESDLHQWRPFQLAFILLCLPGIVDPKHESRLLVDLLWFPTGGGKTEAYLGLTAFTIFLRRLRSKGQKEAAGVTVLMRYTLRLLTIQQFQRASSLILACEYLRRQQVKSLGAEPISLGLWVGGTATPNTLKKASEALNKLKSGEDPYEGNPYQILSCPWCGTKLTPRDYSVSKTMTIRCPEKSCEFKAGLPLYLVDEDVYNLRPSLLIGTVDKFARLPWIAGPGAIFGRIDSGHLPPELIIQDELHLISGPLGTMVGLYETAIDLLCERNGIFPKVIASTATIRRASEQSRNLFNRGFAQFPPPGLDARDNFFSVQVPKEQKPGRLYVGIHAPGKSIKTALLRTSAVLLQRISENPAENRLRDPYWTMVAYFNSLRELGGALRLVEDDIRDRMKLIAKWRGAKIRKLRDPRELNSHCASKEIPELLEILESSMDTSRSLDVLLATNMISVGVDIDRLGLMVVNGQPKTTSEYIQATSRVGRKYPGLVVTVYNWTRPRDRSHYERFKGYHSTIYSQVEPTSVTPFSSRARERGLHGVFIALVRQLMDDLRPETAAKNFNPDSEVVAEVINKILARVQQIDPAEVDETRDELCNIVDRWVGLAERNPSLVYGEPFDDSDLPFLMIAAEKGFLADDLVFPTLNSLRDVEGESELFIQRETSRHGKHK